MAIQTTTIDQIPNDGGTIQENDLLEISRNQITHKANINGILTRITNAENSITTLNGQVFINIKGNWDAATNTPNLLTITKKTGDAYKVNVAGSTDLDGETDWQVNDLAVYGADSKWFKIDNTQFSEINDSIIALNTTYSSTKIDLLLNTKVDKITGKGLSTNDFDNTYKATLDNLTENVQDIMSTTLVDTSTIDFVYDDENNNITASIKDNSIFNTQIANNANIETSKIKQTTFVPLNDLPTNGDLQNVVNNKFFGKINNLQDQINARPVGASNGSVYYFTSQASTVPNYELLTFSPDPTILDIESVTINNTTTKENRLIHSYISVYDINANIINGGVWSFNLYGYVSHLNNSNFEIDVLKRTGTVETLLFTVNTTKFLQITQISPDANIVNGEIYQQDFSCNPTDKIVIKVYGKTDRAQDTTITLLHSGTDYASHVHTPLVATHDQLAGIQGDGTKHISSNQLTILRSLETVSADKVMITDNLLQPKTSDITVDELNHLAGIEENIQIALNNKQRNIIKVNNQTEMLGLSTAIVGDIVIRTDDNNYQYRLNALPASNLSNWEVLGKDAQPVGETVDDIITTNEVITTKPNGLYAFAGIPNGGLPSGVAVGDIASKSGSTYTIAYTFANAPSTIFAKSDSKIYKKTINGSGVNTWQAIPEETIYEVGAGKQYATLQSAIDNYRADFLANKVVVGNVLIYDSVINESITIANDVQNLLIEGFGVSTRGNTQIQSVTLYGHRLTFKNVQINSFILNSTGTISEYGVTTKRGKHIFDGVVFANNTTAIDVQGINNFLTFKNCDFNSKPIAIANNPSANPVDITTISIDGCTNGILNCGTNRLVIKNNSLSVYQGTITGTILDVDGAVPIAYSILRSYSALGLPVPIALKTLIINDDVGGTLQVLKCTTAYTIAASAGTGTAIDLTKYQIETDNLKQNIIDNTLTTTNKTITGAINELVTNKVNSTETSTIDGDLVVFSGTTGKTIKKTTANNFKTSLSLNNVDNTSDINKPISTATQTALNAKENAFTKNTAFNKSFGNAAGTVCEGNDARLGTKDIDETNIANNKILVYNSTSQKLEYQDKPVSSTNLSITNKTGTSLDLASSTGTSVTVPSATTTEAGLMPSVDKVKLNAISGSNTGDETTASIYAKFKNNILAGTNISITQNDSLNTLTIDSTGGGGSGGTMDVPVGTVVAHANDFVPYANLGDFGTTYSSSTYPLMANKLAGRQLQPVYEGTVGCTLYDSATIDPLAAPDVLYAENPESGVILYAKASYYGNSAVILKPNIAGTDLEAISYDDINTKIGTTVVGTYGQISLAFVKYDNTPYFVLAARNNGIARTWRISEADLLAGNNWTQGVQIYSGNYAPIITSNNNDVLLAVAYYGYQNVVFRSINAGISWVTITLPDSATTYGSCTGYIDKPIWNGTVFFVYFKGRAGSATSTDGATWIGRSLNLQNIFDFGGTSSSTNTYKWYTSGFAGGADWKNIYITVQPDSYCTGNYYYSYSLYSVDNGVTFRWCQNYGRPGVAWTGDGFLSSAYSSGSNPSYYQYAYSTDHNTWTPVTISQAYHPGVYGFIISRKFKKAIWYNNKARITVTLNTTFTTPTATNPFGSNVKLKLKMG